MEVGEPGWEHGADVGLIPPLVDTGVLGSSLAGILGCCPLPRLG